MVIKPAKTSRAETFIMAHLWESKRKAEKNPGLITSKTRLVTMLWTCYTWQIWDQWWHGYKRCLVALQGPAASITGSCWWNKYDPKDASQTLARGMCEFEVSTCLFKYGKLSYDMFYHKPETNNKNRRNNLVALKGLKKCYFK